MRISVVIPVFNRAHTLRRALDSIYTQTSAADEIIVVDDGSSDHSATLVEQNYPEVKLIRQPNRGVSAARNIAISQTDSDWIALLDSDDAWLPDKLAVMRAAQRAHPEQVLFHSDEIWIRDGKRVNPMHKHRKHGGMIFRYCLPLCVISPSAAVIARSLFDDVGPFNEQLPACEDYDLWLRICHRYPVHFIDRPLIRKYGGHADQLSKKFWGLDRFRIRSLHALLQSGCLRSADHQLTRQTLLRKLQILVSGAIKHGNEQVMSEFSPLLEYYREDARAC